MKTETTVLKEWQSLVSGRKFITDTGADVYEKLKNNKVELVGRFAVWAPVEKYNKHQVVEVGTNLYVLQEKYHIKDEMVFKL